MNTLLMILSLCAAAMAVKKGRNTTWGTPVAVACAALAIWLAVDGVLFRETRAKTNRSNAMVKSQERVGELLGDYVSERFPGSTVVILTRPTLHAGIFGDLEKRQIAGLRKSLKGMAEVTELEIQPPEGIRKALEAFNAMGSKLQGDAFYTAIELSDHRSWFQADDFTKIVASLGDRCDLLISTVGLPANVEPWYGKPELAVMNPADLSLADLIHAGVVDALVCQEPVVSRGTPGILVVTPENLEKMIEQYPGVFN
jgi:hypothetical protein